MHERYGKIWPGPKPYEESDWKHFFGRRRETTELRERIVGQRLTILAGASGTGKTSLLRAGVVASLRLRRYHPKSPQRPWPVLVLRDWAFTEQTAMGFFQDKLKNSIETIKVWAEESKASFGASGLDPEETRHNKQMFEKAQNEYQELSAFMKSIQPSNNSMQDIVEKMLAHIAKTSQDPAAENDDKTTYSPGVGLILVLDQFEELMRFGKYLDKEVTDEIRSLVHSGLPVRILLSLREEYVIGLRSLERVVGGLIERTYFLEPMDKETVLDALDHASGLYGMKFAEKCIDKVLNWVNPKLERSDKLASGDLLKLQAILHAHHLLLEELGKPAQIEVEDLEKFATNLMESGTGKVYPNLVAQKTIEKWIERALEDPDNKLGVPDSFKDHEKDFGRVVKRVAVRIAPHMSSGDYKILQDEISLLRKALGDDILLLGGLRQDAREKISFSNGKIDLKSIGDTSEQDSKPETTAWIAREKTWSISETRKRMLQCFNTTLHRLSAANVLKMSTATDEQGRSSTNWGLVHDQIGPAFNTWAEARKDTMLDHINSFVVSSGITPLLVKAQCIEECCPKGTTISYLRWLGCCIQPGTDDLLFDNIIFENCDFRGCIFDHCKFSGGGFRDCVLNGALFRECEFKSAGNAESEAFCFERCNSKQLGVLESEIESMSFRDCELTQLTIAESNVKQLKFEKNTFVLQGYFEKLKPMIPNDEQSDKESAIEKHIFFRDRNEDGGGCHCTGDYRSWNLVQFHEGSLEHSCSRTQGDFLFDEREAKNHGPFRNKDQS